MEKRRPTYDLDAIKLAIGSTETLAITTSALRDATALGLTASALSKRSSASSGGSFSSL
jgi:motility quorum-sensing regulator/GCU-specific mRNA interferase toxin